MSSELEDLFKKRFEKYTEVQLKAIPVIKSGKDTLVVAPTGSGKTEAALLPILDMMHSSGTPSPLTTIYITPLRALNRDMVERLREWASWIGCRVGVRHGDTSAKERSFQVKHPPHILITTPETLQNLLANERFIPYLRNLRFLVIDELHELVSSKRGAQLSLGITRLGELASFQVIALSATVSDPENIGRPFLKENYEIVVDKSARPPDISVEFITGKSEMGRLDTLCRRIKETIRGSKALIFTNTRYMAELVGSRLIADGMNVLVHHGSLSKEERESVEERFKKGEVNALVCTSSLELGIDIGDVDLVVHVGSPKQVKKALQRIGRSGHAHNKVSKGIILSYNIFDFNEAKVIAELCIKNSMEREVHIYPCMDVLAHAIVGRLLTQKRGVDDEMYRFFKTNWLYSSISLDDFKLLLSEMHRYGVIFYDGSRLRLTNKSRKYYFDRASTIPFTLKYGMVCNGRMIGYLDERYVSFLEEGETFIMRGVPWTVLSIEEDRVIVEQSHSFLLTIPEWEGEQIPVSMDVAKMVIDKMDFSKDTIRIDVYADLMIIYTFLGSSANNALALALAARLNEHLNSNVVVQSSPYAVALRLPYPMSKESFINAIRGININNEILSNITNLRAFQYIFSQMAYYFGMSEAREHFSSYYLSKCSASYVYKESVNYFFYKYCDTSTAQEFLDRVLMHSKIKFIIHKSLPEIGMQAIEHMSGSQILFPQIPQSAVEVLLGNLPETYRFRCLNCGNEFYGYTKDLPKKCNKCMSVLIAPSSEKESARLDREELMRRASLYNAYGRRALIALSTYGVGTETAARILARLHKDERALALDLLRAREQFIRTKKYWSA
ncbi:MAG: DEAD/DEAH box helicase [Candidatus Micrarchaeia archaeon]